MWRLYSGFWCESCDGVFRELQELVAFFPIAVVIMQHSGIQEVVNAILAFFILGLSTSFSGWGYRGKRSRRQIPAPGLSGVKAGA
jgi:hypothetical protein